MTKNRKFSSRGFTMIELSIAMIFVSILLIAIVTLSLSIGSIYNKGITLRDVNQSGASVSDELKRSIAASTFKIDDESGNYVVKPGGGRLCLGDDTYVWNFAGKEPYWSTPSEHFNKYSGSGDKEVIRMVKVDDKGGSLCTPDSDDVYSDIDLTKSQELLGSKSGDRRLAIHEFTASSVLGSSGVDLVSISFILGTDDVGAIDSSKCKPPADAGSDSDFCAVNQFEITVRNGVR